MNSITVLNISWTFYNGFNFRLLWLDGYWPFNIDSSLLGINVWKNFLYIDILFFKIKVFDKTD